jgi:hypothetical protein
VFAAAIKQVWLAEFCNQITNLASSQSVYFMLSKTAIFLQRPFFIIFGIFFRGFQVLLWCGHCVLGLLLRETDPSALSDQARSFPGGGAAARECFFGSFPSRPETRLCGRLLRLQVVLLSSKI